MTLTRRELTIAGAATATAAVAFPYIPSSFAGQGDLSRKIASAARQFVAALSPQNRARSVLPFAHAEREDWHYAPRSRPGATLGEMSDRERAALWDFLAETISARGLELARGAIKLERVLGELTGNLSFRDPDDYAIVFFGDPTTSEIFAWRFEGHHLSISALAVEGQGVSVTPNFVGANPATVPGRHAHAGFRLLGTQEDRAFQLLRSLEGKARAKAIIADRSLGNIVSGPGREDSLKRFEGVALANLSEGQRDGVYRILHLYAATMHENIARSAVGRVREDGASALHFAWAGSLEPGRPHYFRIHGPSVLIEYDNTQNAANHVHSVWIDPKQVFGRDLLSAHHKRDHTSK